MDRALILGSSRGLGAALVAELSLRGYPVVGFGRKVLQLQNLRERFPRFEYHLADFSTARGQDETLNYLLKESFSKVLVVAGGGPYGRFEERAWQDHRWAWEVSFLFAARVIHGLLAAKRREQLILVGSSVAESGADPFAASYCAAKHALRGLFLSVRAENPGWDIRLFSPGYMDTELLPPHAAVRKGGVYNPAQIAKELWTWSLSADETGHKVYPHHPAC